jgi:hypothetical protein
MNETWKSVDTLNRYANIYTTVHVLNTAHDSNPLFGITPWVT